MWPARLYTTLYMYKRYAGPTQPSLEKKALVTRIKEANTTVCTVKILVGAFGAVSTPLLISVVVKHTNMAIWGNIRGPD